MIYSDNQEQLYNADMKNAFLRPYLKSQHTYLKFKGMFRRTKNFEIELNKDLNEFNLEEMERFFTSLNLTDTSTAKQYYWTISSYIETTSKNNSVPLYSVSQKWAEQFVDKSKQKYLTEKEIEGIERYCVNPQDRVVLRLWFEGVVGKKMAELTNLKEKDVCFKHKVLTVRGVKGERPVEVSDRAIELIKEAIAQPEYLVSNGQPSPNIRYSPIKELIPSEYILKNMKTRTLEDEANYHNIHYRIQKIAKQYGGYKITSNNVRYSGMFKMAWDSLKRYKQINYQEISHKFNMKPMMIRRVVNEETVRELYGEFIFIEESDFDLVDRNTSETQKGEGEIEQRSGQHYFRERLLEAYNYRCAVSGETCQAVIEAAHIQPYINEQSNHIQNGLLLRIDLHRLFDKGLLEINDDYQIHINPKVESETYRIYDRKSIYLPDNATFHPSKKALEFKRNTFIDVS